jgi:hypothetical protein
MKKIFQTVGVVVAFAFFLMPTIADVAVGASCTATAKTGICRASAAACTAVEDASGKGDCTGATESCCTPKVTSATGGTVTFSNPLSFTTVQGMTGAFLSALQGIIVTLALVFLVFGGVLYIISAGDEGRIKTAKAAITAAMIGLAIGVAAPSFLKEIGTILGWGSVAPTAVTAAPSLGTILQNILNFLLSMVGILAIIMLVIGGLMYFAAAGDEKRADTAKSIVKFAIIGIAVSLAALVIVTQIANFF